MARGPGSDRRVKLLLDEHFSPDIARQLRAKGHDAIAVKEHPELPGEEDLIDRGGEIWLPDKPQPRR